VNVAAIATHDAVLFGGLGETTPASDTSKVADSESTHDNNVWRSVTKAPAPDCIAAASAATIS